MPSTAVALRADRPLTPAMTATVWEIASAIDAVRTPVDPENATWLTIPTAQLRGEGSRQDNVWLRQCLDRLTGVKLSGEHDGDPWGAVVLAEWHIEDGGSVARLLIPPAAVQVLRSPATFAKIEATAAHRLTGHGRQLYAILSDKKGLRRPSWTYPLDELRTLMGVDGRKSYDRWSDLRTRVIDPALEAINDYGTVKVTMTPIKTGRSITDVRFDWKWKTPREARDTTAENDRHSATRRRKQDANDAPPMIEDQEAVEKVWWESQSEEERDIWRDRVGREADGVPFPRPERVMRHLAYEHEHKPT